MHDVGNPVDMRRQEDGRSLDEGRVRLDLAGEFLDRQGLAGEPRAELRPAVVPGREGRENHERDRSRYPAAGCQLRQVSDEERNVEAEEEADNGDRLPERSSPRLGKDRTIRN